MAASVKSGSSVAEIRKVGCSVKASMAGVVRTRGSVTTSMTETIKSWKLSDNPVTPFFDKFIKQLW